MAARKRSCNASQFRASFPRAIDSEPIDLRAARFAQAGALPLRRPRVVLVISRTGGSHAEAHSVCGRVDRGPWLRYGTSAVLALCRRSHDLLGEFLPEG